MIKAMVSPELIFEKGFYIGRSNEDIESDFLKQGYQSQLVSEPPNSSEDPHTHSETYIVVCTLGEMAVSSGIQHYDMVPGDKITIPAGVEHTAAFGSEGSTYLWVKA